MRYVREVVGFGPRPVGSVAHGKLENYIRSHVKTLGIPLEEDTFKASTPAGDFVMRNLIAKIPGNNEGIVVIASHYDTNYPLKNFVGANDGGSSTGLMLELASQLRRSSKSICANLGEGMSKQASSKDVVRFLRMALGSCDETRIWLKYVGRWF